MRRVLACALLLCVGCPAPVAIVLGILAIRDLRKQPGKHGLGRAVFAIVAGALVTLVVAAVALLA